MSPVARNVSSQVSTTFCCCFNKSSPVVFNDFAVLMMFVSSINSNPTTTSANWDKYDNASKPNL